MDEATPAERFWVRLLRDFWADVDRCGPDECWPWLGRVNSSGYGHFAGKGAHRFAYELLVGPIPEGLMIDHRCHTDDPTCPGGRCVHRRCQNPAHMEPVTKRVNTLRGESPAAKHARKTHCPQGHPYDQANTYWHRGQRRCKTCMKARTLIYNRRVRGYKGGVRPELRTHCPAGHPYDEVNTYADPKGHRHCRACKNERRRRKL